MSTFLLELVESLERRKAEIETLIEAASNLETENPDLFDSVCRATSVLMISHFEGFIKDAVKAVISDINRFSQFRDLPRAVKRTYCGHLLNHSDIRAGRELEEKIQKLISLFDGLDVKLEVGPFNIEDKKNPSPNIVEKVCNNFGTKKIFAKLNNSSFDIAFSGATDTDITSAISEVSTYIQTNTKQFPYTLDPGRYNLTCEETDKIANLWSAFLDNALLERHSIAHGSKLDNNKSVNEIIDTKNKLLIIQYTFILIIGNHIVNSPT